MGRGLVKVLSGVLIGIIITVLGLGIGAYVLLSAGGTMGKVQDSGVGQTLGLDFTEEQRAMSLLQYGTGLIGVVGNLGTSDIGTIEDTIGTKILSTKLSDFIGLDTEAIRASTLGDIGATIADGLTVELLQDKFGIEFPDNIPLFNDPTFTSTPITHAFGDLDAYTMDKFIAITYTEDATPAHPASSGLMQKLGKKTLGTISGDMDSIIKDSTIGDVIDIDEATASPVMKYLKEWKIGELDKAEMLDEYNNPIPGTGGAIQNMKISDAVAITDDSAPVLKYFRDNETKLNNIDVAIKNMTIGDAVKIDETSSKVLKYLQTAKLDELNTKINAMQIKDAVDVREDSHAVLKAIQNFTLNDIGNTNKLQEEAINPIKLGEIIQIGDNAEPILLALRDTELGNLQAKVATLTIKDIFKDYNVGILSLVPEDTLISEIATQLPDKVTTTSLYSLKQVGVLNYSVSAGNDYVGCLKKSSTHNADINAVVGFASGNSTMDVYTVAINNVSQLIAAGATASGGYYNVTPAVVKSLCTETVGDDDVLHEGAIIRINLNDIKIKVTAGTEGNDNYPVFSIINAGGAGSEIAFEADLKMESSRGGYAHFCCPNITGTQSFQTQMVKAKATDPWVSNVLIEFVNYTLP